MRSFRAPSVFLLSSLCRRPAPESLHVSQVQNPSAIAAVESEPDETKLTFAVYPDLFCYRFRSALLDFCVSHNAFCSTYRRGFIPTHSSHFHRRPVCKRQHPPIWSSQSPIEPSCFSHPLPPQDKMLRIVRSLSPRNFGCSPNLNPTAACSPALCRVCSISTSSASARRPQSPASSTHSAANS
jgi:hypothetical protein